MKDRNWGGAAGRRAAAQITVLTCCLSAPRPSLGFQSVGRHCAWAGQTTTGGLCGRHGLQRGGIPPARLSLKSKLATRAGQQQTGRSTRSANPLQMQVQEKSEEQVDHSDLCASIGEMPTMVEMPQEVKHNAHKRQRFLSAVASIIIAAMTLTAVGAPRMAHAEFEPTDRARPTDEVVLDMKNMQEACSNGWAPNWRETGKASICLEPDGCLWRKVDLGAREPGKKWYEPVYEESAQTYNTPFVNYLTRYIINYDPRWQQWWILRQQAMGLKEPDQAAKQLQGELARFSGSVDYGLSKYGGKEGVKRLFAELQLNYGDAGVEANRQLALTFALLDPELQPQEQMMAVAPPGSVRDAAGVSTKAERKMRVLAADTLHKSMVADIGVRPAMLPKEVSILKTQNGMTLPGFERPKGRDAEDLFGAPHPGGPVKRERVLEPAIYAASAASGLFCCSVMHLITVPVDVIKTRMQSPSFAGRYKGLRSGLSQLWEEEGFAGISRGWEPTLAGFSFYGITVYPGYEMLKRSFVAMAGEANDSLYHVPLVLAAGAASTAIACLGVCPAEVTRIRMVSNPAYGTTAMGVAQRIVKEEGFFRGLYEGFSFVLARQVLFGMVKFLVFDMFASWVYFNVPILAERQLTQLLVSLLSGAVAGVIATIVSQPADAVLTRMKDSESVDAATVISEIWQKRGAQGFFAGLGSRCVWAGAIIAGQFLLYEVCKGVFQITSDDLSLFLDVIGSIALGSGMAGLRD